MKTLIAGGTACLKRCRLITQKNNKKLSDVKIEWPSSCERFCTGSGSSICETAALVSLSALVGEQPFAPTERKRHTIHNTAARLRTKTLIAGRTACLKRCRHIDQKNNKKCMILNRITDQEYRLPPLHVLPGAEAPA